MTEQQRIITKDWVLRVIVLSVVVLFACVVVLAVQTGKKNASITRIEAATDEIQDIVVEFKTASDNAKNSQSGIDAKAIAEGLVAIDRIEKKVDSLKEDSP